MDPDEFFRSLKATTGGDGAGQVLAPVPFAKTALDAFATGPRGTVLEAPVGDGSTTAYLAERLQGVVAVGPSLEALTQARSAVERRGLGNCLLVEADTNSLPFPDSYFAGVYSADLLGHLRQPKRALKEMLRVCRLGAPLVFEFFAPGDSTRHAAEMKADPAGGYLCGGKTFYRYLDRLSLEEILAGSGVRRPRIERVSWEEDPASGPHDVLHQRESWVVVARKESWR
jgi:SAM-dependent methyltransferase